MKNDRVRKITGVAILLAVEIILQTVAFLTSGLFAVSLNLALIPIAIAAIVYGPWAGAFLGLVNGIIVLLDPSTQSVFMSVAPGGTIVTCLLKCTIAGLLSGLVFKLIGKKNRTVGAIVASILVPVINTGLFAASCFTLLNAAVAKMYQDTRPVKFVFLTMIGWNFIFELGVTSALSPSIVKIMKVMTRSDKHAL